MIRRRSWLAFALLLLLIPIALHALQAANMLFHGRPLEALFEDDFFYYLVVAKRFLSEGVPSFDGVTQTNGYHPLWFMVVCGVQAIASAAHVSSLLLFLALNSAILPVVGAKDHQG